MSFIYLARILPTFASRINVNGIPKIAYATQKTLPQAVAGDKLPYPEKQDTKA